MTVFVVAEIGINHNGDMSICRQLIDVAVDAGCDAVKFQKRDIDSVYTKEFLESARESPWGTTQRQQKQGLEFGLDQYREIDAYCREQKIPWFASAWDLKSQQFLREFDCPFNKVASAMLVYEDLLRMIAEEGKKTFVSTGMSTLTQVDRAVEIFQDAKCPFELMHTVSTYPMKDEDANLRVIETLRNRYGCDVGYSGHESGTSISIAAVAVGATSIERHITLGRTMYGSDQAASLEPVGLRHLVGAIRKVELAFGDGEKRVIDAEIPIAKKLREHIPSQK